MDYNTNKLHDDVRRLFMATNYGANQLQIERIMEDTDISDLALQVLQASDLNDIADLIKALNFIYNDTSLTPPVSDEMYDKLVERYKDLDGPESLIGTDNNAKSIDDLSIAHHKYPELRGTLAKIHFIHSDEIPSGDSRKSLEMYYNSIINNVTNKGTTVPSSVTIVCDLKYDGVSQIFECEYDNIVKVLTRYKVAENLGKDVTTIYKLSEFKLNIPECFKSLPSYGVKTECYMTQEAFQRFNQDFGDKGCNRRTAVTSIMNKSEDLVTPSDIDYISIQPFQISTETKLNDVADGWCYCGMINDRHQYIRTSGAIIKNIAFHDRDTFLTSVQSSIPTIQEIASASGIPIDGVVITLLNQTFINALGRKDDVNQFQIAYKISAGTKKTTVTGVSFQVGPITGAITPVLQVDPVVINGTTITNVGLSNIRKMLMLKLHIDDEVLITYDIIPKVSKTSDCKESGNVAIDAPDTCPICNEPLQYNESHDLCFCNNPNCKSRIPGKILNYVRKLGIMGFGKQTINDLVYSDILHGIEDLYRMPYYRDQILSIPGYGSQSYINLYKCVSARTSVYPHELIGALGIPGIAFKRMRIICKYIPFHELVNCTDDLYDRLVMVPSVGEARARVLSEGLMSNHDTLLYLMGVLTIKEYPNTDYTFTVTFSGVRDIAFEKFLEANHIEVSDSWTNSVKLVIVPDGKLTNTTKTKKATEHGVEIMTLQTAKKHFGYTKREKENLDG